MTTYALMHGEWHSGWHWHALVEILREHGYRAVAPDLPIDDPDAGAIEWANAVLDAVSDDDGPIIVVGHSLAGLAVPLVAASRPVAGMVFLSAFIPQPGASASETIPGTALTERFRSLTARLEAYEDGSTRWVSLTDAAESMYDELPRGVALVAASHLRRQYYPIWEEVCPLDEWPDVPATYVVCTKDQVVNPKWARRVSREVLGVPPVELPGGHSPFLARPAQLAELAAAALDDLVSA